MHAVHGSERVVGRFLPSDLDRSVSASDRAHCRRSFRRLAIVATVNHELVDPQLDRGPVLRAVKQQAREVAVELDLLVHFAAVVTKVFDSEHRGVPVAVEDPRRRQRRRVVLLALVEQVDGYGSHSSSPCDERNLQVAGAGDLERHAGADVASRAGALDAETSPGESLFWIRNQRDA